MSHGLWQNQRPTLAKSATDFGKISDRLWKNQRPTLAKSATDFGKISDRLWQNQRPISGKSATDFGKLRSWEITGCVFGKKNVPVFGTKFGKIGSLFGLAWDKSSTLTVLNAKHVWVWIFEFSGLGVTKNKSSGGKLEGKTAQTLMLNLFCVRYFYEIPKPQTDIQSSD